MTRPLYEDGHLGPVTWRDPKTGTMLWMLAAAYLAPILAPLAVAAIVAATAIHAPRCKPASTGTYVGGVLVEGCR